MNQPDKTNPASTCKAIHQARAWILGAIAWKRTSIQVVTDGNNNHLTTKSSAFCVVGTHLSQNHPATLPAEHTKHKPPLSSWVVYKCTIKCATPIKTYYTEICECQRYPRQQRHVQNGSQYLLNNPFYSNPISLNWDWCHQKISFLWGDKHSFHFMIIVMRSFILCIPSKR